MPTQPRCYLVELDGKLSVFERQKDALAHAREALQSWSQVTGERRIGALRVIKEGRVARCYVGDHACILTPILDPYTAERLLIRWRAKTKNTQ